MVAATIHKCVALCIGLIHIYKRVSFALPVDCHPMVRACFSAFALLQSVRLITRERRFDVTSKYSLLTKACNSRQDSFYLIAGESYSFAETNICKSADHFVLPPENIIRDTFKRATYDNVFVQDRLTDLKEITMSIL